MGKYPRGTSVKAQIHDVYDRFMCYLPHALHAPRPFKGVRYSLVYFVANLYGGPGLAALNQEKLNNYLHLGFPEEAVRVLGLRKRPREEQPAAPAVSLSSADMHPSARRVLEELDSSFDD